MATDGALMRNHHLPEPRKGWEYSARTLGGRAWRMSDGDGVLCVARLCWIAGDWYNGCSSLSEEADEPSGGAV